MLDERFFDEQSLALLRWAWSKTGEGRQAEELAQEVWAQFLTAVKRSAEPVRDPERYLWRVAKYVWCHRLRDSRKTVGWVSTEELELPDGENFSERLAEDDETRYRLRWLRQRIVRLNQRQRDILLLRYLDGLSVRDIARRLSLTEATVKWHLHDTREKLKEASKTMTQQEFLYRPRKMHLGINGQPVPHLDTSYISNDSVKQNLCIACYHTPKTAAQLAEYMGVPSSYLETALQWLTTREFLTETPQGYATSFLIVTRQEQQEQYAVIKRHRAEVTDVAIDGLLRAENAIRAIGFHGCDQPMNRLFWLLIYRLFTECELPIKEQDTPFRPDGGRYWPLGFVDDGEEIEYAVDNRGWAYNGTMNFGQ